MTSELRNRAILRPQAPQHSSKVCVVIPVYNYAHYLAPCLRSVLSQEGVGLSVIVIDDASSDDSLAVAHQFSDADPRVRVIAHPHNRGQIATVNEGIAQADGDFVVKLDADDMLTAGSLTRSVALLQAFPSVGFVYGLPYIIGEGGAPTLDSRVRNWTVWPGKKWLMTRAKRGGNPIKQPEAVIRLSALREAGKYSAELPHTFDFEMWMRLAARYDVGRVNGVYQGYYRAHPQSMTHTVHAGMLLDLTQRAKAFDRTREAIEAAGTCPAVYATRFSEVAHRTVAREALSHAISAYSRGVPRDEPVAEYKKVALQAWPDAKNLRDWRTLERLDALSTVPLRWRAELAAREALRDLQYRLRWRRWRRTGI